MKYAIGVDPKEGDQVIGYGRNASVREGLARGPGAKAVDRPQTAARLGLRLCRGRRNKYKWITIKHATPVALERMGETSTGSLVEVGLCASWLDQPVRPVPYAVNRPRAKGVDDRAAKWPSIQRNKLKLFVVDQGQGRETP